MANSTIEKVQELVASGYLNEALSSFKFFIEKKYKESPSSQKFEELHSSIILLNSKYNNLKKSVIRGNLEQRYIDIEKTKISNGLIEMTQSFMVTNHITTNGSYCKASDKSLERSNEIIVNSRTIELTIDANFENYTEADQQKLLKAIEQLLGMENNLKINKIRKGSVIVSLNIPKDKYEFLIQSFTTGQLDKYDVIKIDKEERLTVKMDKNKQYELLNAIPDLNGDINRSRVRGLLVSKAPAPLDLLSSMNGKIKSLLVTLPYKYLKKNHEPYLSYVNVVEELAEKLNDAQLVLLVETENEEPNEREQKKIDEIKSGLKNDSEILVSCVKKAEDNAFSIWSQDAFLIAKPKNNQASNLKYLIKPSSHQRGNRRNDGSIAKGVIAEPTLSYTPLNFPAPLEGGNVLVADDFILLGQDEVINSQMTNAGFIKKFESFFGDEKPLIPISVKYTKAKKPKELETRSGKRGGDTRDLFVINDNKNQLHHDIYRWRGKEQPLFHIDLFITLLGRNAEGKQLIMVGEPVAGFDVNELDSDTRQLFDYQFNDVKERITECLQNLERDLTKNGISYEILRNPLPMTYYNYGWDTSWYWASYNNCLIEITETQKTVWLPRYGTDANPQNLHWNDLKKHDEQQVDLLRKNGFKVYLFNHDFHFLASKSGSLHCMTKCLYRSMGKPKIHSIMLDYKLALNSNGTTGLHVHDGKKQYNISPNEPGKSKKGCMLKVDNGELLVKEATLQHASMSMRLALKGIDEIGINNGQEARIIVDVDYRERHGMKDKELTFNLNKTWVSFHIEKEDHNGMAVHYLVVNSKPDM